MRGEKRLLQLLRLGLTPERHAYDYSCNFEFLMYSRDEYAELCELVGVEPPTGTMEPLSEPAPKKKRRASG